MFKNKWVFTDKIYIRTTHCLTGVKKSGIIPSASRLGSRAHWPKGLWVRKVRAPQGKDNG